MIFSLELIENNRFWNTTMQNLVGSLVNCYDGWELHVEIQKWQFETKGLIKGHSYGHVSTRISSYDVLGSNQ